MDPELSARTASNALSAEIRSPPTKPSALIETFSSDRYNPDKA
jgi:hypothetical protein